MALMEVCFDYPDELLDRFGPHDACATLAAVMQEVYPGDGEPFYPPEATMHLSDGEGGPRRSFHVTIQGSLDVAEVTDDAREPVRS